ncbi:hypothetical protein CEXT_52471 [Caerostris extrusa]|uniref:Uncharacterized protein n=1 Tax=Caerostris extrusa TaxID=172846 RepID=A0AAV4NDW0_CAEEX|nr:hypothetical protein CEXT_52471 [Caerostris extrusa]
MLLITFKCSDVVLVKDLHQVLSSTHSQPRPPLSPWKAKSLLTADLLRLLYYDSFLLPPLSLRFFLHLLLPPDAR